MTPETIDRLLADLDVMTRTIWGEARGECELGQIAVAWVIRNRAVIITSRLIANSSRTGCTHPCETRVPGR